MQIFLVLIHTIIEADYDSQVIYLFWRNLSNESASIDGYVSTS